MCTYSEKRDDVVRVIKSIYENIFINQDTISEHLVLAFPLTEKEMAGLNSEGYKHVIELLYLVFEIDFINDNWSESGISDEINKLVQDLAENKWNNKNDINYIDITDKWFSKINSDFSEKKVFFPIAGLHISEPIKIGEITFYPINKIKDFVQTPNHQDICLNGLNPNSDSFSSFSYKAENRKSIEITREKTEKYLNFFRFMGSMIWFSEPPRYIFLYGRKENRISYPFLISKNGDFERYGISEFSPKPYLIDEEFINKAKLFGWDYFLNLFSRASLSQVEQSILTAINWYGDAIQEYNPLSAFQKFFTAIEVILKFSEKENAFSVLPKRINLLLNKFECGSKRRILKKRIEELVKERNHVFHTGIPNEKTSNYLAHLARYYAMHSLNILRQNIENNPNIQTFEELKGYFSKLDNNMNLCKNVPQRIVKTKYVA